MKIRLMPVFLATLLCFAGCGRRKPETPPPVPAGRLMDQLHDRLQDLEASGETNDMIQALNEALQDARLEERQTELLLRLLNLHLGAGDVKAAQALHLSMLDRDPAAAIRVFGIIESYLRQHQRTDDLVEWCELLLSKPSTDQLHVHLFGMLLEGLAQRQDWESLMTAYDRCARAFPEEQGAQLVGRSMAGLIQEELWGPLVQALDYLAGLHGTKKAYSDMINVFRIRFLLQQPNVEEAAALLIAAADSFTDRDLARTLNWTVTAASEAHRTDLAERLCDMVTEKRPPDSQAGLTAGRHWVILAGEAGNTAEAQRRLAALLRRGVPVSSLLPIAQDTIYMVMDGGDEGAKQGILDVCSSLHAAAESESEKALSASLLLDACFMTDSFERALETLEAGVSGKDEEWHKMLIVKVKAHKALKENRVEDAIGHFRAFMVMVERSDESLVDPSKGTTVPVDSIIGFNAARIGDLWKSLGKPDKARAAYDEARTRYLEALAKVEAGSAEHREIRQSIERLPQ